MGRKIAAFALLNLALVGCNDPEFKPQTGPTDSIYYSAAQYSREHNGQALLIYRSGQTVFIDNQNGGSVDTPYHIFSGTKSFNCAIALSALQAGLLTTLDDLVSDTITEWQGVTNKQDITVRQLLNFTSGIDQKLLNLVLLATDEHKFKATLTVSSTPGTAFAYGETHSGVFEELMHRKLVANPSIGTTDTLEYLKKRVLDVIGLSPALWLRNSDGRPFLSFGAYVSAREWLKYGILLHDNGAWGATTVFSSANLSECTTGSAALAMYGMNFWLNVGTPSGWTGIVLAQYVSKSFTGGTPSGLLYPGGPSDLFAAVGTGDNRLYISRSNNIVIVRMGRGGLFSTWQDSEFLRRVFNP